MIRTLRDLSTGLFALEGAEYIDDTEAHIGDFYRFHALEDSEIETLLAQNLTGNSSSGMEVSLHDRLDCQFYSIKLASGRGMAYKLSRSLPPGVIGVLVENGLLTYSVGAESFSWPVSGPDVYVEMDALDLMISVADDIATLTGGGLSHTFPVSGSSPDAAMDVFLPSFIAGICTFILQTTKSFSFPVS